MRARLISVGKPKNTHTKALCDDYIARITRLGLAFDDRWVAEERPGGRYSDDHVMERESRRLVAELARGERLIAVDRRGTSLDSERLAPALERWARPRAAFVLGGPLGHHLELLERADEIWSLGPLTLPHELARVVVVEQIYRAMTLIHGVPYHK